MQGPTIAAQEVSPTAADARHMRAQMQRELLLALLPEKKAYRDQLLALEKRFATDQDFAEAIRTRNERQAIDKELGGIEKELAALQAPRATPLTSQVELKCTIAKVVGTQLDATQGILSGWDAGGANATWTLPDLPPGGYEIVLKCTGEGGVVTFKESFYSLQAKLKPAKEKPLEQNLGTLRIKDGKGPLSLTVNSPEQCKALHVYSVVLVPSAR